MKDQLISFETAKLAKEKGLIEGITCYHTYCIGYKNFPEIKELGQEFKRHSVKGQLHLALTPTQSLLQKWLREKHFIHVEVETLGAEDIYPKWYFRNIDLKDYMSATKIELENIKKPCCELVRDSFNTYEEALEAGLYEALKTIKL